MVVLFTNGAESPPKALPLPHANLLTTIRDVLAGISAFEGGRLLGMLASFQSFGLTRTMLLPLALRDESGAHADPTAVPVLARIIAEYRPTLLPSTPMFTSNSVRGGGANELSSRRICVNGAKSCSSETYDAARRAGLWAMILEGYRSINAR
ncbi:MAG: AMP-binding protein [Steroidobacteraceae bacterium]